MQVRIPKYLDIADVIRNQIESGEIAIGSQLPPDSELAMRLGVNKRTVGKGMLQLVAEGLIMRSPRKGTVVLRHMKVERQTSGVALFLRHEGDVYDTFGSIITKELFKHNLYPIWIDKMLLNTENMNPELPRSPIRRTMERILDDSPYGAIVDGDRFVPLEPLRKNLRRLKGNLVFLNHYLYAEKIEGAKYVLSDVKMIGHLMARNLLEHGHRRITFFAIQEMFPDPKYYYSPQKMIILGMLDECRLAGAKFDLSIPERLIAGVPFEELVPEFRKKEAPTGAGSIADSNAVNLFIPVLKMAGIRIPDHFSLIGCYDTPWAVSTDLKLSSIAIHEDKIAKTAMKMFFGEIKETDVLISPSFVKRESVRSV